MFSPSRDTIYRHQRYGRCAGHHPQIFEVDKDTYTEFCKYIGRANPPRFGNCVPTQRGTKPTPNKTAGRTIANKLTANDRAGVSTFTLPTGCKIPKKERATTTPPQLEEGEVLSSDDKASHHTVASVICRTKRPRAEDAATALLRA